MTTAPRISDSGRRRSSPGSIGPVVRPALVVTLVIGLVACVAGALVAGSGGLLGALIGTGMVAVFFGSGALVLDLVAGIAPSASLMVALLTYTLKVVLIGLVFVGLDESGALSLRSTPSGSAAPSSSPPSDGSSPRSGQACGRAFRSTTFHRRMRDDLPRLLLSGAR